MPDTTDTPALRIAVAEDEDITRMYIEETILELGHRVVVTARDGRELLERCRVERPDLVVTDISMPVMTGLEAALRLTQELCVPVVLITGYDFIGATARAAEECPILLYLVKPFTGNDLAYAILAATLRISQLRESFDAEDIQLAFAHWRKVEAAKFRLMRAEGFDEEQAFHRLKRIARETRRSILETADDLVGEGS
ncbi:MAG: response regulator [FCB group bacterium]|nr:response regulator [FCB group bacterium]